MCPYKTDNHAMLSPEEMIGLQAEKHDLIKTDSFQTVEEYVLHLIHGTAYIQAAKLTTNKKVLDLGCNNGYGSNILSKSAGRVVGVDVSEKAIQTAINQFGNKGIEFQKIDGITLPFESNSFDIVVSFQVIEHIVDIFKFISEIKRVTNTDRLVIFTTPNAILRLDPGMKPWNKFHVREYDNLDLYSLLKNYFKNVNIFGLFANEPLYSVEVERVSKARKKARNKNIPTASHKQHTLKASIKRFIPETFINVLRGLKNKDSGKEKGELKNFINNYNTNEFYYKNDNLESALDFFAICSDNQKVYERIEKRIIKQPK